MAGGAVAADVKKGRRKCMAYVSQGIRHTTTIQEEHRPKLKREVESTNLPLLTPGVFLWGCEVFEAILFGGLHSASFTVCANRYLSYLKVESQQI